MFNKRIKNMNTNNLNNCTPMMEIDPDIEMKRWEVQQTVTVLANADYYYTKTQVDKMVDDIDGEISGKQDKLIAGDGISISGDVISVTGGSIDSGAVQTMIDQSISGKAETSAVTEVDNALTAHTSNTDIHVTSTEKETWNNKSDFSGSYDDLSNKPTIPSSASQLVNDEGYITSDAITGKADITYVDEAVSGLTQRVAEDEETTSYAINVLEENKQDVLWAGEGISISGNVISVTGGGITSGEVQTMIDESISGKTDESDFTAHTSNTDIHVTTSDKQTWNAKADLSDIPSVSGYADSVMYNSTSKYVEFYHGGTGGTKVFEYDASPFIIDGMVQNVEVKDVTISGESVTCLVISFNTDAGHQDINIPISEIFDASNYYDKTEVDAIVSGLTQRIAEDEEVSAYGLNMLDEKKQDVLWAGDGISISGNVISATGGGGANVTVSGTTLIFQ